MFKKVLFITLVLFGFTLMAEKCFADASAQLEQARIHIDGEQYEQAKAIYNSLLANPPDTDTEALARGGLIVIDVYEGNVKVATSSANEFMFDNFSNETICSGEFYIADAFCSDIADAFCSTGNEDKAKEFFTYILETYPALELLAKVGLIKADIALGNIEQADSDVDNLLSVLPAGQDISGPLMGIADYYRGVEEYGSARRIYESVIDTWPECEEAKLARSGLIQSNIMLGNIEQANRLDQYVIENGPGSEDAIRLQVGLAKYYIAVGDEPNAQAAIDKLLAEFSDNNSITEAVYDIADEYLSLEKYEKAKQVFQYVLDNWPRAEEAMWSHANLAISNIKLGKTDAAQAVVDKLLTEFSDNNDIAQAVYDIAHHYLELAVEKKREGLLEECEQYATKYIETSDVLMREYPESDAAAKVCANRIYCYLDVLKDYDQALYYAQKLYEEWPSSERAWYGLFTIGNLNERMKASGLVGNEVDTLITEVYKWLVKDYPECYKAKYAAFWLAESAFEKENWDDVIFYNEFLLTKFESGEEPLVILYPLALAYDNIGRYEDALETYKLFTVRVNTTDPRRDSVLQRIAELEAITGGQVSMISLSDTVLAEVFGGCQECVYSGSLHCSTGGPLGCGMGDACIEGPAGGYYCKDQYCKCDKRGKHCVDIVGGGTCTPETRSCAEGSCRSMICICTEGMTCVSTDEALNSCIGTFPYCR